MIDKRRLTTALGRYVLNPVMKTALSLGIAPPGYALLETIGRTSGRPRRTPVTNGLHGDTFWIVAEHGRRAGYVRNLLANPRVRVKLGRRWRTGTAHVLPEDDPQTRLTMLRSRVSRATVRVLGTDLLTIRVDLDAP